jgi:hypothetical protein
MPVSHVRVITRHHVHVLNSAGAVIQGSVLSYYSCPINPGPSLSRLNSFVHLLVTAYSVLARTRFDSRLLTPVCDSVSVMMHHPDEAASTNLLCSI